MYFPEIVSAIDIPPGSTWSEINSPRARLRTNKYFEMLLQEPDSSRRETLLNFVVEDTKISLDEVVRAL
nr:hypothetical protein [Micromonospora sp. DSM 115978]